MANSKENSTLPRKNIKAKAHAAAGWEWFKSAAWLQVLLIVGIVVGIVISIPYIVSGIRNATNNNEITFYKDHRISYNQFQKILNGEDTSANGVFGKKNSQWDDETEGFSVMFYKDNCDNCSTMQENLSKWYTRANSISGGRLKFYTINVGWIIDDKEKSTSNESNNPSNYYLNEDITLDQQYEFMQSIKQTYLAQDELHSNTSVTASLFDIAYSAISASEKTLPTPLFVSYSKKKTETKYTMSAPSKVMFSVLNDYSVSSSSDILVSMYDLYNFTDGSKKSTSSSSSSSSSAS